jgi:hypothetical protein
MADPSIYLTQERLKELFDYDPATGILRWRVDYGAARAGREAGTKNRHGYRIVCIDHRNYYTHRLVHFMLHGWVPPFLDHMNGVRDDNRDENLREVTKAQNAYNAKQWRNNTSGHRGVYWVKRDRVWKVIIQAERQSITVGSFDSLDKAINAHKEAVEKYHGEYAYDARDQHLATKPELC